MFGEHGSTAGKMGGTSIMKAYGVKREVAVLLVLLGWSSLACGQESLGIKAAFPKGLFLVRARIKDVTPSDRQPINAAQVKATLVIEHVYAGPDKLKGRTFEASTSSPPMGSTFGPEPVKYLWYLQKHTEGLWWLRKASPPPFKVGADGVLRQLAFDPEKLEPVLDHATLKKYRIEAFPYLRDRFGGDFEEGLAWAEAVEDVFRAKSDLDRGIKLARLAARDRPPIADWATAVLVSYYSRLVAAWPHGVKFEASDEAKALRRQADNKKLSPESRIALDRMLAQLHPHDWPKSAQRENLLSRCFATDNVDDFSMACLYMLDALWAKEMDFEVYAKVLDPVLRKADKMPAAKQWLLGRTLREPRWETGYPPYLDVGVRARLVSCHFAWLKKHLQAARSPILRVHAAAGFRAISPISDADAAGLRKLCANDAAVKRELDHALDVRPANDDDGAARRAAHFFGRDMYKPTGPYYVGFPFYTGGAPLKRGNKVELPVITQLNDLRIRLPRMFPGGVTDQVTRAKLWDLRAALTQDPELKLLAETVANDKSLLYVVHLYQPGRTDDLALLVRVERGTGSLVGPLGVLGPHRNPNEKQLRQTAAAFVKAYNRKSKVELEPLLGSTWCHGGYHAYAMADGSKPTYPPEVDIGPYGKPAKPWAGGPTARGLPVTLPTEIKSLDRYEDQRRALICDPKGLQALDRHMGRDGYVALLGSRPDCRTTLLLRIENGRTQVVGTLSGLCGLNGKGDE
jgi:hypothetical protein